MLVLLIFVTVAIGGTPLLAVNISGVPRALKQFTRLGGRARAIGPNGTFSYSSAPDMSNLGLDCGINSLSGSLSCPGELWIVGDFGPFNFIATDSLGNVAVSPPVFLTSTSDGIITTHFRNTIQCEQGTTCFIAPQFSSPIAPIKFIKNGGQVPAGMNFSSIDGSYSGIVNAPLGSYKMFTIVHVPIDLKVNNDLTVIVVAPLVLDLSFMQPTCGKFLIWPFFLLHPFVTLLDMGFNFSSRLAWTGGPQIEANARGPTPSMVIEIISGSLPPGVRFAQLATQTGSYQIPQLVGSSNQAGNYNVTFSVSTYTGGKAIAVYNVSIVEPPKLNLTRLSLVGEVDVPFTGSLFIDDGGGAPFYWFSANSSVIGTPSFLPFGVTIQNFPNQTAQLIGTPAQSGTSIITLTVQPYYLPNPTASPVVLGNPVSQTVEFVIHPKLVMPRSLEGQAEIGAPFSLSLQATGGAPGTIEYMVLGDMPPGLNLDTKTGSISGQLSATNAGIQYSFSIMARDAAGASTGTNVQIRSVERTSVSLSSGAIAGIVVGALVAIALITVATIAIFKKWNASAANFDQNTSDYHQLKEGKNYKY